MDEIGHVKERDTNLERVQLLLVSYAKNITVSFNCFTGNMLVSSRSNIMGLKPGLKCNTSNSKCNTKCQRIKIVRHSCKGGRLKWRDEHGEDHSGKGPKRLTLANSRTLVDVDNPPAALLSSMYHPKRGQLARCCWV
jgi:hypothetical protein